MTATVGSTRTHDQDGNALLLVDQHADEMRFTDSLGWLTYDGHRFVPDTLGAVREWTRGLARQFHALAATVSAQEAKTLARWATASATDSAVRGTIALAESDPRVRRSIDVFDADPWQLNTPSGVVDLRDFTVTRHRADQHLLKLTRGSYHPDAECPTWLDLIEFITMGDAKFAAWLQRLAGYLLNGDTSEHLLVIAYGGGANAKSTYWNTLAHTLGDYAVAVDPTLLLGEHGAEVHKVALRGARLAIVAETGDGRRLQVERMKALTGGDLVTARPLYRMPFSFAPTHTLVMFTNSRPHVGAQDYGTWRRMRLLPFTNTVTNPDLALPDRLRLEVDGILAWAVEGARAYRAEGLNPPPAVVNTATASYRSDEDLIGRFVTDYLEDHPERAGQAIKAAELYEAFTDWCHTEGLHRVPAKRTFGERLTDLGAVDSRPYFGKARARAWTLREKS